MSTNESFSPATRRICELAHSDAVRLKHPLVGTEHLLSAIMGDVPGNAAQRILTLAGAKPAEVLQQLLLLEIPLSHKTPPLALAPVAETVFEHAVYLAHHQRVEPEHFLHAIIDRPCAAHEMLKAIGVDLVLVRVHLAAMREG